MMTITARLARWARIALVLAALAAFGIAILPTMPGPDNVSDKVNHALAFFVLAVLARAGWPRVSALRLFLLLTAFGGFIEVAQYAMDAGRSAETLDLLADMAGIAVGLLVGRLVLRFAPELIEDVVGE